MPMIRTPAIFWMTPWAFRKPFDSSNPLAAPTDVPATRTSSRVPQGIDEEKESAINDVSLLRHESQQHGQDGDGTRRRDDAEEKPQKESAEIAPLFHPGSGRDGQVPFEEAQQVEPHDQADPGDGVFPEAPDVPEHPAEESRDEAQGRERHGQSQDEEQGKDERRLHGRRLPVSGDDAHQERDHGQDAGVQGRGHAAEENGDDRQPGVMLEKRGDVAEKAGPSSPQLMDAVFFQELDDLLLGKKPDVAENLLPLLVQEDLGGDQLDAVFAARLGIFPDIVEDDLDPSANSAAISFMIGCIALQGMQRSAPSSMNVTRYLEKSISRLFVTRTLPLTAKIGGLGLWPSAGGPAAMNPEGIPNRAGSVGATGHQGQRS